jgi:hypothetical protein
MSSSQKSQLRGCNRFEENQEEETRRREPFRAVPINRKNSTNTTSYRSHAERQLDAHSIDSPLNGNVSSKRLRDLEDNDLFYEFDDDDRENTKQHNCTTAAAPKRNCYANDAVSERTPRTTRAPAATIRGSASSQSTSSNRSSALGISDDSTVANEHLNKRIEDLESDVVMLKAQIRKLITQGPPAAAKSAPYELTTFQASVIGRTVREDMFKAIKFIDQKTIQVQGQKLFLKCLEAGKIEDQSDNKHLFDTIMKRARKSLNVFKSHVKSDIRKAARCKLIAIATTAILATFEVINSHTWLHVLALS